MRTILIAFTAFLLLFTSCYKTDTVDQRATPFGDSGLTLIQVVEQLQTAGLAVNITSGEVKNVRNMHASNGIELALKCRGAAQVFRVYRLAGADQQRKALDRLYQMEASHRENYPGFRYAFLFNKNLLLVYDEIHPSCREELLAGFSAL